MIRKQLATLIVLGGISCAQIGLAVGLQQEAGPATGRAGYAGDASCAACHRKRSDTYQHTPHHLTSQLPTPGTVHGSFRSGDNTVTIADPAQAAAPRLQFVMESRKDGMFETARTGWGADVFARSERMDVITGSGMRGQTYLGWQGDRLFELPISYWSDGHRWINSPGYIDGTAEFSRPVNPACLECHATYIRALSSDPGTNRYDRESLMVGIACESCHGPGANHVRREMQHLGNLKDAPHDDILNPAKFSRDRKVDLCAECHNGIQREALKATFSYVPGRPLSEFFKQLPGSDSSHPDVHGNQVGLLEKSKCYQASEQMSCTICHDVHTTGRSTADYSLKCQGCHTWQSCGMSGKMGHTIANKCIECHMPIEETDVIVSQTAGKVVHAKMRNHWIKVYPDVRLRETAGATGRP